MLYLVVGVWHGVLVVDAAAVVLSHTLANATSARSGRQPLGVGRLSGDAARAGGLLSQALVRSVGVMPLRSVLASLAVPSGRTALSAVLEHGSSVVCLCRRRRRWTMPHGAVVAWRRAPALEPRSMACHCLAWAGLGFWEIQDQKAQIQNKIQDVHGTIQ